MNAELPAAWTPMARPVWRIRRVVRRSIAWWTRASAQSLASTAKPALIAKAPSPWTSVDGQGMRLGLAAAVAPVNRAAKQHRLKPVPRSAKYLVSGTGFSLCCLTRTADPATRTVDQAARTTNPATRTVDQAARTTDPATRTVDQAARTTDPATRTGTLRARVRIPSPETIAAVSPERPA